LRKKRKTGRGKALFLLLGGKRRKEDGRGAK